MAKFFQSFSDQCIGCQTEGQICGGMTASTCCLGQYLACNHKVHHLEGEGVCEKVCSSEGQICGGFTPDPKVCCEGFKCVVPNTGATDLPGKCHLKNSY
jgi:hypothetical protein